MREIADGLIAVSRFVLPIIGTVVLVYCIVSLLRYRFPASHSAVLVEAKTGNVIQLSNWENSIGRSNACDIIFDDDSVSRFHGVIARRKKGWTIIDTYSKTGIFINGQRINSKAILENGDTIAFGSVTYKFSR